MRRGRRRDGLIPFGDRHSSPPPSVRPSGGVYLSNLDAPSPLVRPDILGWETWARHVRAVLAQIVRTRVNLCRRGLLTCPSQSQVCRYVVSLVARHRAGIQPPSLASDIYLSLACSRIRISVPNAGTHSEQMRETGRHIKAGIICYPT